MDPRSGNAPASSKTQSEISTDADHTHIHAAADVCDIRAHEREPHDVALFLFLEVFLGIKAFLFRVLYLFGLISAGRKGLIAWGVHHEETGGVNANNFAGGADSKTDEDEDSVTEFVHTAVDYRKNSQVPVRLVRKRVTAEASQRISGFRPFTGFGEFRSSGLGARANEEPNNDETCD